MERAVEEFIANNGTIACPDTFNIYLVKGCHSVSLSPLAHTVVHAPDAAGSTERCTFECDP